MDSVEVDVNMERVRVVGYVDRNKVLKARIRVREGATILGRVAMVRMGGKLRVVDWQSHSFHRNPYRLSFIHEKREPDPW